MPLDWGGLAGRGWPPPSCVLGEPDGFAGCSFGSLLPVVLFFFGFLPVVLWAEPLDVVGGVGSALTVWGDVVEFEVAGCGAVWMVAGVWQVVFGPGLEFVVAGCSVAVGVCPCHCACLLLFFVPCSGREPAACASVLLLRVALTFQCVMVSCRVRWLQGLVKTTKAPACARAYCVVASIIAVGVTRPQELRLLLLAFEVLEYLAGAVEVAVAGGLGFDDAAVCELA